MPVVLSGPGTLLQLPQALSEAHDLSSQNVALLLHRSATKHPSVQVLVAALQTRFFQVFAMPFSSPLLNTEEVKAAEIAIREALPQAPSVLISIGGGTVLDLAKLLKKSFQTEGGVIHAAVPTTAGTGSEATCFAVLYKGKTKLSIEDPSLLPEIAVLDPHLLQGLPRQAALYPALDALCQAVESIWSVRATSESVALAAEALALIRNALIPFLATAPGGAKLEATMQLQRGAHLSGQAIQLTRTTAGHALSYRLTARHGVPHGLAVFLNLPRILRYNAAVTDDDCADPRGAAAVRERIAVICRIFEVPDTQALERKWQELARELDINLSYTDYGVALDPTSVRDWIAEALESSRSDNNPRRLAVKALTEALAKTLSEAE